MSALLIGSLLVILSAAVFGYALFGSRPVPQSATASAGDHGTTTAAVPVSERGHSEAAQDSERPQHSEAAQDSERAQGSPAETPTATEFDTKDPWVRVPLKVRFRSALLLLLGAIGSAVVIGAVIGVFVVALILLVA